MPVHHTLIDALEARVREQPEAPALSYLGDGENVTEELDRGALAGRVNAVAQLLASRGLIGQRAVLLHASAFDFAIALLACLKAGVVAVPSPRPRPGRARATTWRFERLLADACPAAVLVQEDEDLAFAAKVAPQVPALSTGVPPSLTGASFPSRDPDELALIQYTSGSTSDPRGVRLSLANLTYNAEACARMSEGIPGCRSLSWLPPFHDMGLVGGLLAPLLRGLPLTLFDTLRFVERPARWLAAISRYRLSGTLAPVSALELCARLVDPARIPGLDLSCLRIAVVGAEPISPGVLRRFEERFAPFGLGNDVLVPSYGLAEATLIVTHASPRAPWKTRGTDPELTVVGRPIAGTRVAIFDGSTQEELEEGQEGEIRILGPGVSRGYWGGASLPGSPWLATGDLGRMVNGELVVSGRIKDVMIFGGANVHPTDIEETLREAHPDLDPAGIAVFSLSGSSGEELHMAVELTRAARRHPDAASLAVVLSTVIARDHGLSLSGLALLAPGTLPRTTSGKLRRVEIRRAYREGTLALLGSWTREADPRPRGTITESDALSWLFDRLSWPEGEARDPGRPLAELCDSLRRIEVLSAAEARHGVRLPADAFSGLWSMAAIARALESPERAPGTKLEASSLPLPLGPRIAEVLEERVDAPGSLGTVLYLRLPPHLGPHELAVALARLEWEHDALRFRHVHTESGWQQTVAPAGEAPIELEVVDGEAPEGALAEETFRWLVAGVDLARGPLIRARLVTRGPGRPGLLALFVHHFAADALGLAVLLGHLSGGLERGTETLPHGENRSCERYLRALAGLAASPEIEADHAHWCQVLGPPSVRDKAPSGNASRWKVRRHELDDEASAPLLEAFPEPGEQEAILFAAAASAWNSVTGSPELIALIEHHGRLPVGGISPLASAGWFASEFPVRVSTGGTPGALVRHCRQLVEAAPHSGLSFGLLRWMSPRADLRRELTRRPPPSMGIRYRASIESGTTAGPIRLLRSRSHYPAGMPLGPKIVVYGGTRGRRVWFELSADVAALPEETFEAFAAALRTFHEELARCAR